MTGIPEKLVRGLKEFCKDMAALGIPCGVEIKKDGHVVQKFGKMAPVCPQKIVFIRGGATLKVNGDFKLHCIGNPCMRYPCATVKPETGGENDALR